MSEIFTWEYVQDHWLAILIGVVIIIVIAWRWHAAGKEAEKGPVSYALVKHRGILFLIGIITFILLILFISYGGPYLARFGFWGFDKLVDNTEAVVIQNGDIAEVKSEPTAKASPTSNANPQAPPTPGGDARPLSTGGQTYCTKIAATVRSGPSSTATSLGDIPADTTIKLGQIVDSNCVDGVCQRGQLAEAVGSFPVGSWIHLAAATAGACP